MVSGIYMRPHRYLLVFVLTLVFLFGISVKPAFSAYLASIALPPTSIETKYGPVSGAISSLGVIDQSGNDDNPSAYMTFGTSDLPHLSYDIFKLPPSIKPANVSAVLLQVNFSGPPHTVQTWAWSIFNWSTNIWVPLGDTVGVPSGQWNTLVFRIYGIPNYVSSEGEISIQLKSNARNGIAKLDYEALHFTYLPVTPVVIQPTSTAFLTKSKYTFPSTYTPTITFTPTVTPTPTATPVLGPEPLFVNPYNPRYFTDGMAVNGKYRSVLLTGSHTWCNLIDCGFSNPITTPFDYTTFLNFLKSRNMNFFRLWRAENARGGEAESANSTFYFSPMPYARSTTCCAYDGGNKFDLTQWNQAYFDRMRARVIQAGDKGIYVSIMLFDGWSVQSKFGGHEPWKGHPYNSNNNITIGSDGLVIDGDTNNDNQGTETHTLSNTYITTNITPLQKAYIAKVIETVHDLDNVLFEISNESDGSSSAWQYGMVDYIKSYEQTHGYNRHPVGMTWQYPNGSNANLTSASNHSDWISLGTNGIDINAYALDPTNGSKVIISDTDHICGICGNHQWVWRTFTRGGNPAYMDIYDKTTSGRGMDLSSGEPADKDLIRLNMGYVRNYATRMNLTAMTPTSNTSLCSTGYCLRNPSANGAEYLVYIPSGGTVNVNLVGPADASLAVEWFNPNTGATASGGTVLTGATRSFTSPFGSEAVLYIYDPTP
jgi:hypothetical protein